MSDLIKTINEADTIAGMWRAGKVCALRAGEKLAALGFYGIAISDVDRQPFPCYFRGVRFVLGGDLMLAERSKP